MEVGRTITQAGKKVVLVKCHGFMPRAHVGQYTGNLVGKSTLAMANDEGEAKTKAMIIGHR
ncbi:hypothetical protein NC652_027225 [Populus alba x Populus x berolinensis]|nr:hypothetical protein NC652_027225 [Populus alba x Populus x berolinensis]